MSPLSVRPSAVAGQFYPHDPVVLQKRVQEYVDAADLPPDLGAVRAVVAPHAGYPYSGPIAGYAFKALAELSAQNWTVFLMGPSHRVPFDGVALGRYTAFRTPLGDAPVAVELLDEMAARSPLYSNLPQAHAPEHCLEVEVPFLQTVLADFRLVPMLFGSVDPEAVAQELVGYVDEDTLLVVSSDLSHYHPYDRAQKLDRSLLEDLLAGEEARVLHGEACGRAPLVTMMNIAQHKGWKPHLLDYRSSGDTAGDRRQVVGYAAIVYTA
jgi:hypothetical protein